jgi:PadR family transcriptional regulator, regulatory protein PadR
MENDTQILKGILEGCLLKIISREDTYGYGAVVALNAAGLSVNEATVYPMLARLQKKGMLAAQKRPSSLGPDRKYYMLTELGERHLQEFGGVWERLNGTVNRIMEEGKHTQKQ